MIKSNDFRHLCDNVCSKEDSPLCFAQFIILALFRYWKKQCKKLDPDVYLVFSNESEVPAKEELDWMREIFSRFHGSACLSY